LKDLQRFGTQCCLWAWRLLARVRFVLNGQQRLLARVRFVLNRQHVYVVVHSLFIVILATIVGCPRHLRTVAQKLLRFLL
jgi:hypothetical protein